MPGEMYDIIFGGLIQPLQNNSAIITFAGRSMSIMCPHILMYDQKKLKKILKNIVTFNYFYVIIKKNIS